MSMRIQLTSQVMNIRTSIFSKIKKKQKNKLEYFYFSKFFTTSLPRIILDINLNIIIGLQCTKYSVFDPKIRENVSCFDQ